MIMQNPGLVTFPTRLLMFRAFSFASIGDYNRTIHFVMEHFAMRLEAKSLIPKDFTQLPKQKYIIRREKILHYAMKLFKSLLQQ